ncbi:MAG: PEPxxWA-CTERM sorting domain-containing protein [Chthoniobacterales bacterium]
MKRILFLIVPVALIAAGGLAYGDVVANYNFTSGRASTDTDPNSVASTFDGGPGFQTAGVDNSFIDPLHGNSAPSIAIDATFTDGTTQGQAITANDYYTFTISPVAGALSFTSLSFDYANYSSSTFPTENFFVRSSADNFSANLAGAVTAAQASAGTFGNASVILSSIAGLQNVTAPIEFRIYVYDSTSTAGRGALLDNITLNGFAPVPEPSTWAMMIAGAGLLGATQRLRRKRS